MNGHSWGQSEVLLADLVDAITNLTFQFISANSAKPPKQPKPYPRPPALLDSLDAAPRRAAAAARQKVDSEHLAAWLETINGPAGARRQAGE